MALKENLIKFMDERNLTIRELAALTDISEPTLKRLRSSKNINPTLDVLIRISRVLSVTVDQLIEEPEEVLTFQQNDKIDLNFEATAFIYVFNRDTFLFSKGTKAIFKVFRNGDSVTKYIFNLQGVLLERLDFQKNIFRDESSVLYSIESSSILAFITKELYEVNYV